ncbi:MAG: hypothetical protein KF897_15035 [Opitutaceae bacterium]|nr:hypothetical protein [Opitutaceae bacterium]
MPRVTVALFQGPGLVSRLIRWQTRSAYSHAAIVLPSGAVIESREGIGVRQLPHLEPKNGEQIDFFAVEVTEEQLAKITAFLHRQLNKGYDWTMVARFITRRQESRASRGRWFCSELVFAAFLHAGVILLRGTEPWEVSPGLLARSPLLIAEADVIPFPAIA